MYELSVCDKGNEIQPFPVPCVSCVQDLIKKIFCTYTELKLLDLIQNNSFKFYYAGLLSCLGTFLSTLFCKYDVICGVKINSIIEINNIIFSLLRWRTGLGFDSRFGPNVCIICKIFVSEFWVFLCIINIYLQKIYIYMY